MTTNEWDYVRGPEKEPCPDCGEASCAGHGVHYIMCDSCQGSGCFDLGDCEDGLQEPCLDCEGLGEVSLD